MTSTHIYPYVYRGIHPTTGEFYIGMRSANKVPAEQDLGYKYRTSSKFVAPRFEEFEWHVVAEFFTHEAAYDFEQLLIFENMHDCRILNKSCFHEAEARFWNSTWTPPSPEHRAKCADQCRKLNAQKKGVPLSAEHRKTLSLAHIGKTQTVETIAKRVASLKSSYTDESRKIRSNAQRGILKPSEKIKEHCRELSRAHVGKKRSEVTKQKMRDAWVLRKSLAHLQENQGIVSTAS